MKNPPINLRVLSPRTKFLLGFTLASLIFICLRLKTLGHLLMWDEARNMIALRAYLAHNAADPFYLNYFFHPPLYMIFAGILAPFKSGLDIRLELLSLVFSYITLIAVYLLSVRIGGLTYAFLSGAFLALMPISVGYDTWIKRDCLASALGYIAILLLSKRKYAWCAVALSFSLLAKESALLFILAVTCLLFLLKEKSVFKKIFTVYSIIFILTGWWYLFFSDMPKLAYEMIFSAEKNIFIWTNSPLYYFKKLLPDMGFSGLIFFIIGISYSLYLILRKKQRAWLLPLAMFLCVFIPVSFFVACKTPWTCLAANGALAMIAGIGALFLLRSARKSKLLLTLFVLLFIQAALTGFSFSYDKYHMFTYPNGWAGAESSRELAFYLNKKVRDGEKLMLTQFSYWGKPPCVMCPIFLYYWNGNPIYVIDGKDSAGDVIKEIIKNKIAWLVVIDSSSEQYNFHALVKDVSMSRLGIPAIAGRSYIWKTDSLWR